MAKIDLNDIEPEAADGPVYFQEQSRNHTAEIDCFFDGLELALIHRIAQADLVVGCMAWLTNRRVLGALAETKSGCQVVVQKEDFLRPGKVERNELQRMYGALRCPSRFKLPIRTASGGAGMSYCDNPTCGPVRVMGIRHARGENGPRMHHKFFVFCREVERVTDDEGYKRDCPTEMRPYAVWTGSFNATENATRSRENAIYIRSESMANLYCAEWSRTLALSESLDWTSDYIAPEWRFGS
jgi:hypothetical protein